MTESLDMEKLGRKDLVLLKHIIKLAGENHPFVQILMSNLFVKESEIINFEKSGMLPPRK